MPPVKPSCTPLIATILLCFSALAGAAERADGPYLERSESGGWIAQWVEPGIDGARVRRQPVAPDGTVAVAAVGRLPAFEVGLRGPAAVAPDAVALPSDVPLLVVADTHGEYEIVAELLRRQEVVDDGLHWTFGQGHLVFLGDVFSRGAHQTEILWLIYRLEAEAAAAGGGVHLLLGNHEAATLLGDTHALHPRYLHTAQALGVASYPDLFGARSPLGQWLRTRASVLRLGDALLAHGGISPDWFERGLTAAQVNRAVREVLAGADDPAVPDLHAFATGPEGPLHYRGYFPRDGNPPTAGEADVEATLRHFGVDTILVGHTRVPTVTPLYGGRVIAVQVYPTRDEATGAAVMEAALREGGHWHRAGIDGSREPLETAGP